MKTRYTVIRPLATALIVSTCMLSVGCKGTSWRMPGSNMFASSREPDASLLASGTEQGGVASPAQRHEPSSIASSGGTAPSASTVAGTQTGSAYGAAPQNPYASAQTTATPQAGLAAQANGYQTGPYSLGQSPYGGKTSAGATAQNPYGGSYAANTNKATAPDVALPSSVTNSLASGAERVNSAYNQASSALSTLSSGTPTTPVSYPQLPTTPASSTPSSPAAAQPAAFSPPAFPQSPTASTNSGPNASMPQAQAYTDTSTSPSGQQAPSTSQGVGVGGQSTNLPALPGATAPAYGGSSSLGAPPTYSPGTTSRNTGYDFSGADQGAQTLPPNTASSTNPLLR